MTNEDESQGRTVPLRPDREYGAAETAAAHQPFVKIVGYVLIAQLLGLVCCIAVYQQFGENEDVRSVMLTSAMIFAIGVVPTVLSFMVFRRVLAMSNRAAAMLAEGGADREVAGAADDLNAEATRQGKNAFKLLSFSVVCLVASTLIGISGLLSL